MTSLSEQLSAVRQSQWEAQLDIFRTLTSRALDSAEQLISLNLRASRTSVEQATGTFKQLLDASNPREFIAVGSRAQGQWHYLFEYGRELLGIASGVQPWTGVPPVLSAPLHLVPTANVPTSYAQIIEQASIATADATMVTTEIAAAAADTSAALAEATLHAGTQAVQAVTEASKQPIPAAEEEVAQQFEAAVDTAIADDVPPAKLTPVAEALNEVAPKPASEEHPIASLLPLEAQDHVELPVVTPTEATPPLHATRATPAKPPRASRSRK